MFHGPLYGTVLLMLISLNACTDQQAGTRIDESKEKGMQAMPERQLASGFGDYWYANKAELTSYKLEQARYGEIHEGQAVLVYVTEPFDLRQQVKENDPEPEDPNVLKLNRYKHFYTGVYPYTIMTSSFLPVKDGGHARKITNSIQEWCGQVFMQLNNRDKYHIKQFSYFQSEGDTTYLMEEKPWLEDELWNLLRLKPEELPTGQFTAVPAFSYLRLSHQEVMPYTAQAEIEKGQEGVHTYELLYPALRRYLKIHYRADFPHTIEGWKESYYSGFGKEEKKLTTTAELYKRIRTDYWNKNGVEDSVWRDSLGLRQLIP